MFIYVVVCTAMVLIWLSNWQTDVHTYTITAYKMPSSKNVQKIINSTNLCTLTIFDFVTHHQTQATITGNKHWMFPVTVYQLPTSDWQFWNWFDPFPCTSQDVVQISTRPAYAGSWDKHIHTVSLSTAAVRICPDQDCWLSLHSKQDSIHQYPVCI